MIFALIVTVLAFSSVNGIQTTSGNTCTIPFIYQNVEYNSCILRGMSKPWCVTGPKTYKSGSGLWEYCCPSLSGCNLDCSNRGGFVVANNCKTCQCKEKAPTGSSADILVFRQREGCGGDPGTIWAGSSSDSSTPDMASCNWKSPLVEKWGSLKIYRVFLAFYNNKGEEQKRVVFNGWSSDKNNWFIKSRIIQSSWSDLGKGSTTNFDSIDGWKFENKQRSFYFNKNFGGCDKDAGWFGVTSGGETCFYDAGPLPVILYASTNGASLCGEYNRAAEFRIYVKRIPQ